MLNLKTTLNAAAAITLALLISSCSTDNETEVLEEQNLTTASRDSNFSPWDFRDDDEFVGDQFQADNDGNGAHNWTESQYESQPNNNGFTVSDFIFLDGGDLILQCPNDGIRSEFRDNVNMDLDDDHKMDFYFTLENYDGENEIIIAQIHNDHTDTERPYITVSIEDDLIQLKQSDDNTKGSSTTTSSSTLRYREGNDYRITIETDNNDRSVFVRIRDESDGNTEAKETFSFNSNWNSQDGSFYWKFGAYMPDGGSENTKMRLETITITGQ